MEEGHRLKLAIISGASHVLKFKSKNPRATDDEAIQHIARETESILRNIDEDL